MRDQSKKWKTWQKITVVTASVLLIAGLGLLLFPVVSNLIGQQRANSEIDSFNERLHNMVPASAGDSPDDGSDTSHNGADGLGKDGATVTARSYAEALQKGEIDEEGYVIDADGGRISSEPIVFEYDLDALYRDSLAYNRSIINHQGTIDTIDYAAAALDMRDYGLSNIYCYLSAPSIDLDLPVYLGANDVMMSCGAAHLAGTSLPVDQDSTNVAIAGHTGYIGRIFFDNIRRLDIGDTVTIGNYWGTIDYKVIDHKIVDEDMTDDIYIQEGRQLLTLITCIWTGKNNVFDRYLVICEKESSSGGVAP